MGGKDAGAGSGAVQGGFNGRGGREKEVRGARPIAGSDRKPKLRFPCVS